MVLDGRDQNLTRKVKRDKHNYIVENLTVCQDHGNITYKPYTRADKKSGANYKIALIKQYIDKCVDITQSDDLQFDEQIPEN